MIKRTTSDSKGFTLIELLVVIAIIGVLSSLVMGTLVSARLKSRDSKIKQHVIQMRNLIELDQVETNPPSYANLQQGWFSTVAGCNAGAFAGNHAAKAREICAAIVSSSASNFTGATSLYIGNSISISGKYSIMAYLPSKQRFFCIGSNGKNSETTSSAVWTQPGCSADTSL